MRFIGLCFHFTGTCFSKQVRKKINNTIGLSLTDRFSAFCTGFLIKHQSSQTYVKFCFSTNVLQNNFLYNPETNFLNVQEICVTGHKANHMNQKPNHFTDLFF